MARVPAFATAFAGRWRIVEMDAWDNDFLDLAEQAHLAFDGEAGGEIALPRCAIGHPARFYGGAGLVL